jgi:hypothetical protein
MPTTQREKAVVYMREKVVAYFESEKFESGQEAEYLLAYLEGLSDDEFETDEREENVIV